MSWLRSYKESPWHPQSIARNCASKSDGNESSDSTFSLFYSVVFLSASRAVINMGKQQPPPSGGPADLDLLKIEQSSAARDVDFGQVLETTATPQMERKVLWKLDLL